MLHNPGGELEEALRAAGLPILPTAYGVPASEEGTKPLSTWHHLPNGKILHVPWHTEPTPAQMAAAIAAIGSVDLTPPAPITDAEADATVSELNPADKAKMFDELLRELLKERPKLWKSAKDKIAKAKLK